MSDDFHACELDSIWTFVDPRGDASAYALDGSYTDDARLALTVPGGVIHELWNARHHRAPRDPAGAER